jgi:hypothetical protein
MRDDAMSREGSAGEDGEPAAAAAAAARKTRLQKLRWPLSYQQARLEYVRAVAQRYLNTVQPFMALVGTSPSAPLGATLSQSSRRSRDTAGQRSEPSDVF